jgi:hypothetical protein
MAPEATVHRFEFRARGDSGAIFIGTFGILMLSGIAIAIVISILYWFSDLVRDAVSVDAAMIVTIVLAFCCAFLWVRHWWRIPRERKIVLDRDGVTYVRFRNQTRLMRWDDIREVKEVVDDSGDSISHWLTYKLGFRSFKVDASDYDNYGLLKLITVARLPDRTKLAENPYGSDTEMQAVAEALRYWGFPQYAQMLPSRIKQY